MEAARQLADKICADLDEAMVVEQEEINRVVERHTPEPPFLPPPPFQGWIDSVEVQGIRAFGTNQVVGLSRGLTILYAENGAGKTSFIDAMELLSGGATTRSRQFPGVEGEVKDQQHVPHATTAGKTLGSTPRVVAHWYSGPEQSLRTSTWEAAWGTPADNPPPVALLARRRLREIINAKGVERADRLTHSLGLGSLAAIWIAAEKYLGEAAEVLIAAETVESCLADAVETCVRDQAVEAATTHAELIDAITRCATGVLERADHQGHSTGEAHSSRGDVLGITIAGPPALPQFDRLARLVAELRDQQTATSGPDPGTDQALVGFLASFREVALVDTLCPGCEVGQVTAARLVSIDEMLAAVDSHRRRQREVEARRIAIGEQLRRIANADLSWTPTLALPANHSSATAHTYEVATGQVGRAAAEWTSAAAELGRRVRTAEVSTTADDLQLVVEALRALGVLHHCCREVAGRADALRRTLCAELAAKAPDAEWLQATYCLTQAETLATTIHNRRRNAKRADAHRAAARTLKSRLKTTIDKRFQELAGPINEWLMRLAPDHTPQIQVATKATAGRAALQIHVEGGKVAAIGRLSDSQLDMLGLAAHLATLEREAPGHPVFIDDPTDMLDHPTRDKLASDGISRLLGHSDVPGRQVVVLTHDHQLVQSLWHHHGHNTPFTMQAVIETDRTGKTCEAVITPRTPDQYLKRVDELLVAHSNESNRIWLRNAAGNLTRQALELIVKDVLIVAGPQGHEYLSNTELQQTNDKYGVGKAFDALTEVLVRIADRQRECGELRHRSALRLIEKLTDAAARRKDFLLDEASHPNVVYPSAPHIRSYAKSLQVLAAGLTSSRLHDEWPTTCTWYKELTLCGSCRPYDGS